MKCPVCGITELTETNVANADNVVTVAGVTLPVCSWFCWNNVHSDLRKNYPMKVEVLNGESTICRERSAISHP